MKHERIISDAEWRQRLTEEEFERRMENMRLRQSQTEHNFLEEIKRGAAVTVALLRVGTNYDWLRRACREGKFRQDLFALLPSKPVEPFSDFGRWIYACDRTRGSVGFCGSLHPRDAIAVARVAAWSEWLADRRTDVGLDVVVCGEGAPLALAISRLAPDGIILGLGLGPPKVDGFRVEVVNTTTGRFFRMSR